MKRRREGDSRDEKDNFLTVLLPGILCFTGLGLLILGVNCSLLLALWHGGYTRTVVLVGIVVPYYAHILWAAHHHRDGAPWPWFSRNFGPFRFMRRYLDLNLVMDDAVTKQVRDKNNKAQYVFAVFPHGAYADFRVLMDAVLHDMLPELPVRTLATTVLFYIPVLRELALWTGCVDASRSVAERLLQNGRSILVLPGGMKEQLLTQHGREIVYLSRRQGFLKLAIRHGVPVVPVYAFGVSDSYHTSRAGFGFRQWLVQKLGVCIVLAYGYGPTSPLPVPTTLVFGKPLQFSAIQPTEGKAASAPSSVSREQLVQAHAQFCTALRQLFDQHKTKLGYGDRELEIL